MESLQNEFEEIIESEIRFSFSVFSIIGIKRASKECVRICLQKQINILSACLDSIPCDDSRNVLITQINRLKKEKKNML